MKKKGILRLCITFCLFLLLVMFSIEVNFKLAESQTTKPPVKLGFDTSVSGVYGGMGKWPSLGIPAWVKMKNRKGGILGHPIELFAYDNGSDPTKAVVNAKKLIYEDGVHVIVGQCSTGMALAFGPACAAGKTAFLSQTGSAVLLVKMAEAGPETYKWVFWMQNPSNDEQIMMALYGFKKVLGIDRLVLLNGEGALGTFFGDLTVKWAPKLGVEVVERVSFPVDAVTFGAQVARVKAHPEAKGIFVWEPALSANLLVTAFRDAGIMYPIVVDKGCTGVEQMKLEKVRKAFKMAPTYVTAAMEVRSTLPKGHPMKARLDEYYEFMKTELRVEATSDFEVNELQALTILEEVFASMLKDQPDIFNKDLATIRSAIRDYIEKIGPVNVGKGIFKATPDDHCGYQWGSGNVIGIYGKDELWHYRPEWNLPESYWPKK
jgi:branched-chain amino acid transport system substrate-binding protein